MSSREASIHRQTSETDVRIQINLDGAGKCSISTGIGFFDHMLSAFGKHARLDLEIEAEGDRHVDLHHTVEDVGIVLGQVIDKALGDRCGIVRFASIHLPMDEALAWAALDISGRPVCVYRHQAAPGECAGEFPLELVEEFFRAVTQHARLTLHLGLESGRNAHHVAESLFKAFARVFYQATRIDPNVTEVPSTKGVL